MKDIRTVIEENETTNEYGVKVINELVRFDKLYSSGKIAQGYTEFVWYKTVGDRRMIVCSFKTEKKIRETMEKFGF